MASELTPASLARLQTLWQTLLAPYAVPEDSARLVFRDLAAAYSGPARFYHNLDHIAGVLAVIDTLHDQAHHLPAVQLAAWFHDVVYDTHAADNEEQSAAYARRVLTALGLPADLIAQVVALILATKDHRAPDDDSMVLLDADLAILGADSDEYQRYAWAIRQEYAWVPEAEYCAGRAAVLQSFLARARIYHTEPMFATYEAPARRNLRAELTALAGDRRVTSNEC